MTEQSQSQPDAAAASFAAHVRAFHAGLPAEEQALLEQVFVLAEMAASQGSDTSGHALELRSSALISEKVGEKVSRNLSAVFGMNLFNFGKI